MAQKIAELFKCFNCEEIFHVRWLAAWSEGDPFCNRCAPELDGYQED